MLQGRLQTAGLRGSTRPSSCPPSLPTLGSWRIQQLSQPSALKVPNHPWGSELGCSEQPRTSRTRLSTHPQGRMGLLGTSHSSGDREGGSHKPHPGLTAQLCPAGDGPTQLRKVTPTPCTLRKTHLGPAGSLSAPLLTPELVLHQHTAQPDLSACQCDHSVTQQRGWNPTSSRAGTDLPGPGSATPPHPIPSHSPQGEAQGGEGGGALHPTTGYLTGESSWAVGNGKVINRSERKISKTWRINDSWQGREASFNMELIENKIELI